MAGYDGRGTIPESGRVGAYRERVCGNRSWGRFLRQGTVLSLFSGFPTILGAVLRPRAYRMILGGVGRGCLIGRGVKFFQPGRVRLGERVFVGEGAFFDVGGEGEGIEIGSESHLGRFVTARTQKGAIRIGKRVNLGAFCFLYAYGDIEIGDDCLIANQVEIVTGNHECSRLDVPMRLQGRSPDRVVIGRDCWIGTHAVILGGVTIGEGAVVGAGAVVTKDVEPYGIAAGVPAELIGSRAAGSGSGSKP